MPVGVSMGYVRISRCEPRITITMSWGCDAPLGAINLYMKRVGEPQDFAVYPPIDIRGSVLTFQFDELLFQKLQGRYEGRLVVGTQEYKRLHFEYRDNVEVLNVESANV
jgi:hypothetical protein